jgi:hypothetical protein
MKEKTGYWMFVCNPRKWQIDKFIESGKKCGFFTVSSFHKDWFEKGHLGIIRVGNDTRSKKELGGRRKLESGIYALVKVLSSAQLSPIKDDEFWLTKIGGGDFYQVEIEFVSTFLGNPILIKDLHRTIIEKKDELIIKGFQGSSYPISRDSFNCISALFNGASIDNYTIKQKIDLVRFEILYDRFEALVTSEDKAKKFFSFDTNKYIQREEGYKDTVFEKSNNFLSSENWTETQIGTGFIFKQVCRALGASVNLVPWQDVDKFNKLDRNTSEKLEEVFLNLYQEKVPDRVSFQLLQNNLPNHYSLIAYFFFLKDRNTFLPISTTRLERALEMLGIRDFKLSGKCSWGNYSEFISYIKQVQYLLMGEYNLERVSLLNAHSFAWMIPVLEDELKKLEINEYRKAKNIRAYNNLNDKERETIIKARVGQGKFRELLIEYWKGCSVTGCRNEGLLTASHMKPWKDCTIFEAQDPENGFLLIPNIDSLFDKGFVSFHDDGSIIISNQLSKEEQRILGVSKEMTIGKILTFNQKRYLEYHRKNILK